MGQHLASNQPNTIEYFSKHWLMGQYLASNQPKTIQNKLKSDLASIG